MKWKSVWFYQLRILGASYWHQQYSLPEKQSTWTTYHSSLVTFATPLAPTTSPLVLYLACLLVHSLIWLLRPLTNLLWNLCMSLHHSSLVASLTISASALFRRNHSLQCFYWLTQTSHSRTSLSCCFWNTAFTVTLQHCGHTKAYLSLVLSGQICIGLLLLVHVPAYHVSILKCNVICKHHLGIFSHWTPSSIPYTLTWLVLSWSVMDLLTCINRFTRWPKTILYVDISMELVARAFISRWITCFRVPSRNTTDCGHQFKSCQFHELLRLLEVQHIHITSYHPSV